MSTRLAERFLCVRCNDDCVAFTVIENNPSGAAYQRHYGNQPDELCSACSHPWIAHTPSGDSTDILAAYRRGHCASTQCGGYHPHSASNNTGLCSCGAPWGRHLPVGGSAAVPQSTSTSAALSSSGTGDSYRGPPIDRFEPPPIGRSSQAARSTSAIRTLGRSPMAVVQAAGSHQGARASGTASAYETMRVYDVLLWPVPILASKDDAVPAGFTAPPPVLKLTTDLKAPHFARFQQAGLVIPTHVPSNGLMTVSDFTRQLTEGLARKGFKFPQTPDSAIFGANVASADSLIAQPWILLRHSMKDGIFTFKRDTGIEEATFGIAKLEALAKRFPHPSQKRLLIVAPRHGPIIGRNATLMPNSLEGEHWCVWKWVLRGLPSTQAVSYPTTTLCTANCPSRTTTPPPTTSSLVHPRDSPPNNTRQVRARRAMAAPQRALPVLTPVPLSIIRVPRGVPRARAPVPAFTSESSSLIGCIHKSCVVTVPGHTRTFRPSNGAGTFGPSNNTGAFTLSDSTRTFVITRMYPAIASVHPDLTFLQPPPPAPTLRPGVDFLRPAKITQWVGHLHRLAEAATPRQVVIITAPTVEAAAACIMDLLRFILEHGEDSVSTFQHPINAEYGTVGRTIKLLSFFRGGRDIKMYSVVTFDDPLIFAD